MVRTPLLTALGLMLLSAGFAPVGLSRETSREGRMLAAAVQADVARNQDYSGRNPRAAHSSAVSATAYIVPSSSDAQVSAVSFHPQAPRRPETRDFFATGPLATRLTDPTFGPAARPADLLIPDPPARLEGVPDLLCIAVAIYHEARSQTLDGQLAVASVILNRTREPERWGVTPCAVVEPVQFSFLREDGSYPAIPKDESWAIAVEMASEALERGPSALVGQADHYHTPAVNPDWSEHMEQVVRIQNHIFFADLDVKG